jgi:ADP-heptose:LPS heptosyltransferase
MHLKKIDILRFSIITCNWLFLGYLLDFIVLIKNKFLAPALLIIRIDSIGDYVLFRNFLTEIKQDAEYGQYRLIVAGNRAWKSIAEKFDSQAVNNFIWIDKEKFRTNIAYFLKIALAVKMVGAKIAIEPTLSRVSKGDFLIAVSRACQKIGSIGYDSNITLRDKKIGNTYYTKLIPLDTTKTFEFIQNKIFWQKILHKNIKTDFNFTTASTELNSAFKYKNYLVIFPGAQSPYRRWPAEKFGQVAKFITEKYNRTIIIAGGLEDKEAANKIIAITNNNKVISLAGQTSPAQLFTVIAGAEFLISNDSCAIHMATAAKIPTICIANGDYFGRFTSCPPEIFSRIWFLFPEQIEKLFNSPELWPDKIKNVSGLSSNDVLVEQVINLFQEKYLNKNE